MPNTISDILGHIRTNGLVDVVLDAVPLEDHELTGGGYNIPYDRPPKSILVDLAVLEQGKSRVLRHYNPVSLELCDLSIVVVSEESDDPDTLSRRQHDQVYCKYLQQCAKRQLCTFPDSRTRCSLLVWYETRLCELSDAARKQR